MGLKILDWPRCNGHKTVWLWVSDQQSWITSQTHLVAKLCKTVHFILQGGWRGNSDWGLVLEGSSYGKCAMNGIPSGKLTKKLLQLAMEIVDLPVEHGDFPSFFRCLDLRVIDSMGGPVFRFLGWSFNVRRKGSQRSFPKHLQGKIINPWILAMENPESIDSNSRRVFPDVLTESCFCSLENNRPSGSGIFAFLLWSDGSVQIADADLEVS